MPEVAACPVFAYDVRVGLTCTRVEAVSAEEAIARARRQLCCELPRLWDVISGASAQQFVVQRVS